jgi:hypothetical protein
MNKLDTRFVNIPTGFKNRIINGDFQIWQRGTSASYVSDSVALTADHGYKSADRIYCSNVKAGGQFTVSKSSMNGFNSFKVTVDTPPDNLTWDGTTLRFWDTFEYRFEGNHLYDLIQKKTDITISFLFRSNVAGKFSVLFRNNVATDGTRSWGIDSWATSFEYDGSETPRRYSFTIPLDNNWKGGIFNDNNFGFNILLCCIADPHYIAPQENTWISGDYLVVPDYTNWASQAGNYIEIAQLQLEEGDTATDFEYVPYDIQLLRCMRYYETIRSVNENSTTISRRVVNFRVVKRSTPTVTIKEDITGTVYIPIEANAKDIIFNPDNSNPYGIWIEVDAEL